MTKQGNHDLAKKNVSDLSAVCEESKGGGVYGNHPGKKGGGEPW